VAKSRHNEHAIDTIDRMMDQLISKKSFRDRWNHGPWLVAAEYLEDWASWIRAQVDAEESVSPETSPPLHLVANTPTELPESRRLTASDNQQLTTQIHLKPLEVPEEKTKARAARRCTCPHGGVFGESTDQFDECEQCMKYKSCENRYLKVGRE
jgi:hypothetical protein